MSFPSFSGGQCHAESVALSEIARDFGTPCYVYSRAAIDAAFDEFADALSGVDSLVCYAIKANPGLAFLDLFARKGAGFDIVSGGELERALAVGADPAKIVFSGVGKTADEMRFALNSGICCFNVESEPELDRLAGVAADLDKKAPVSLRVNPDVDPGTHPYISTGLKENKFGVAFQDARRLYRKAATLPGIEIKGIDCHIGSQILDPAPYFEALDKVLLLVDRLASDGIHLRHIDVGGGFGIRYTAETAPPVESCVRPIVERLRGRGLKLLLEPGRRLVGNAGLLLTRVEYLKSGGAKNFAVVDAAMNDLVRPALYGAEHEIVLAAPSTSNEARELREWEIVGPVCESGDFLGKNRTLSLAPGDLLAVLSAGAYGMSMSSNYNSRPRAAEVVVDGARAHLVRRRESLKSLYENESPLP
ncbi:MAG: diaminopimelate decarboxylase [Candidatus Accumulibacter sp.]|jgi:diaminopimelate decarboxylase|nr:diaminopimelate decarboxylase [Accumulibacter sp.]